MPAALAVAAILTCQPARADDRVETAVLKQPEPASAALLRSCAAFDLLHVTHVEEQGEAGEEPPERIAAAAFEVLAARRLCREGRAREGLDAYGRITLGAPKTKTLR